jgi:hypothetical protein
MRKTLSRLAGVMTCAVLAALVPGAGPASAATSADCNPATSTKLLTGGVLGNTTDHLWVDYPTPTRTVVCFRFDSLSLGGFTVIADAASGATPPRVDLDDNPALCPNPVLNLTDPVALRLAVGIATNSVCLTVGTSTLTVQFTQGNISPSTLPVFELWRDGGPDWGWIDVAACPVQYAEAVAFGGSTACMATNARVFP